jgi:signal transduction histidine kinase
MAMTMQSGVKPNQSVPKEAADFLAGGGEMGRRMRAFDWSKNPLGPVAGWPQSLRTAVRIMLMSRQPFWIGWGKELTKLYNDPYRAIIGGKHPLALGQPASVVWREIWDQIGPMLSTAMRGDEGTYVESQLLIMERNGYPEETYYTYSYSPIPNDIGGAGGIICANTDDTQRVIGERQLALLRELASGTADARTWKEACEQSARALRANPRDLPFALIYVVAPDGGSASLAAASGIERGHAAAPETVALDGPSVWPFAEVLRAHTVRLVHDLAATFGDKLPTGAWHQCPSQAAVLPIPATGATGRAGVLVVGLNPFRLFDDAYEGFLGLVAGQITASMGNAQAYEEEKRRAEALAELDRAKTTFFSNVSHEFRTPLTLMLGPVEELLAKSHTDLSPAAASQLEVVNRNGLRLLRLVNTLLDFSRIEAGRVRAVFQPTDLAAFTADLASVFRSACERAGLRLVVDCPALAEPVYVDREMWEKIVLNLLSNAFKFTFAGGITVSLRQHGKAVELRVEDTGSGIPAEEMPQLFERFHRVESARGRTHEGSGIGLALVQELVKLHGGSVTAESVLGRGTTFTLSVPLGSAHLPADRISESRSPASTVTGANPYVEEALRWLPDATEGEDEGRSELPTYQELLPAPHPPSVPEAEDDRPRVLVADDNADMRQYVARLLAEQYRVEAVPDGEAALVAVKKHPPDLLLADVMMPRLDGFGLLRELRASPRTSSLPVILLSARAGEESRVEGMEAGADDYLVKPFSARELLARVSAHLQIARQRAAELEAMTRLHALSTRLLRAESLSSALNDVLENAILTVRADFGNIQLFNPQLGALEIVAQRGFRQDFLDYFRTVRVDEGSACAQAMQSGERILIADVELDPAYEPHRKVAADAGYRGVQSTPLKNRDGMVLGMLSTHFRTPQRLSERDERLLDLYARYAADLVERFRNEQALKDADRRKDEFLATLAHELRNPLAPLRTGLQVMKLARNDVKAVEQSRTMMERQVEQMVRLIDDLLDLSRISRGKITLQKTRTSLATAVRNAVETSRPLIEAAGHDLTLDVPDELIYVDADEIRLAQVFANLLNNAAKYTDRGGSIRLAVERQGSDAVVTVEDNGVGIPAHMLPKVFEMFTQVDQSLEKSQGGLGIGLSIVKQLVEMHGGSIEAASGGHGMGSTFTVRLPVVLSLATDQPGDQDDEKAMPTARRRILVVDDNRDSALSLAMMLNLMGNETQTAYDGLEAVDVAAAFKPDVILLDIGMPKLNGYDACRRIREQPWGKNVVVAACTGWGQDQDKQKAQAAGFTLHMVKPVDPAALENVLAGLQMMTG